MMKILFTRSDKIGSKLIRAVLQEDCSHTALQWDDLIIHSTFAGVHITPSAEFLAINQIMHSVDIPEDIHKLTTAITNGINRPYDVGAFIYLGLKKYLPFLPKKNLWQSSGMYLCTEWVTFEQDGKENSMITPHQLYLKLSKENPS